MRETPDRPWLLQWLSTNEGCRAYRLPGLLYYLVGVDRQICARKPQRGRKIISPGCSTTSNPYARATAAAKLLASPARNTPVTRIAAPPEYATASRVPP